MKKFKIIMILLILVWGFSTVSGKDKNKYGVYEYVVLNAEGTVLEISETLSASLTQAGWKALANFEAGVADECSYKVRVLAVNDSAYTASVMDANKKTGPFGVVDRIAVFEDEKGVHVSVLNPHSILRTILMDDHKYKTLAENHLQKLRTIIIENTEGTVSEKQYGQIRKKGHISKTMGVMAGGDFITKLEDKATLAEADLLAIAEKIKTGLSKKGEEWGFNLVYELNLPAYETIILGTTSAKMETKSYGIVGAGSDNSRDDFKCPGQASAPAYPVAVVITKEDSNVNVRVVNMMFRMKIYFEDAGKWAFMKNMGMPGSLMDEIEMQINSVLGQ